MRKGMVKCLVVMCCGVLLASGCAKQEMVKKEEPLAPVTPPPVQQPAPKPPVREEVVQAQPVKEAPVVVKEEPMQQAAKATAPEVALETIYFAFDSSTLSQASRDLLYKNAELLLKKTPGKIQVEGHCDERGSDEYNLALGERRAKAAMNYLVTLGVQPDRLSIISYGKEKPAVAGHDEAAWAKNRRAEFVIVK